MQCKHFKHNQMENRAANRRNTLHNRKVLQMQKNNKGSVSRGHLST